MVKGKNQPGEGTVYQRADGRWVAAAWVPTSSGTARRMYRYSPTRAAANRKLSELIEHAQDNIPVAPANLSLEAFFEDWLRHTRSHVRPTTWKAYEANARLHILPRIGRKKLTRLGVRDVRLMLDEIRAQGAGVRTVQYVHATLRAAMEHAYREDLVSRNVVKLVRVESPRPRVKEPLSADEARQLLAATDNDRNHALWTTMLMLGLRRSEICGLRWDDVDLNQRTLKVAQSVQRVDGKLRELPTKTRRSTRTIPLPARVFAALGKHREETRGEGVYVFGTRRGTPLEPRNLTRVWTKLCESQGMRQVPLHGLRHTCVSLLLQQGVHPRTVMEIVGHSAIEMTMNVYGHTNLETQRRALDDLDRSLA